MSKLTLHVGVKTDPAEYRFSYRWLFRLMAEEGIHHAQLGTFFELYHLPDEYFVGLKRQAEQHGIEISSVFTSHRELGGFLRSERSWQMVARRNYERLIEVAALVGAGTVGSNPGSIVRDQMDTKAEGIRHYLCHMKELMRYAHKLGVPWLAIEPMSCLAEPPTLPDEIRAMARELGDYRCLYPGETSAVGYCMDVAHAYVDRNSTVQWDNMSLLEVALPYTCMIHLKNTDHLFSSGFGFSPGERDKGIVQVEAVRDLLLDHADVIPVRELVGYLEIDGPKRGRDNSDFKLEEMLRQSLRYLREAFRSDAVSQIME
jgi:sugar phosphate isomerase/epimerase